MAVRNYSCKEREKCGDGIDITALDEESNKKILLRMVNSSSGVVGVDTVRKMWEVMESKDYDKGFLLGKRFTDAAKQEMVQRGIQRISEKFSPTFNPERLFLRINHYVNKLCGKKCGKVPQKESDCQSTCRIRVISDNAGFHFEQGWLNLMKNDLKQLLVLQNLK